MGLPLFFLPNLPGATFIHGGTFISDLRAVEEISASQLWRWNSTTGILENEGNLWKSNQIWKIEPKGEDLVNIYSEDSQSVYRFFVHSCTISQKSCITNFFVKSRHSLLDFLHLTSFSIIMNGWIIDLLWIQIQFSPKARQILKRCQQIQIL